MSEDFWFEHPVVGVHVTAESNCIGAPGASGRDIQTAPRHVSCMSLDTNVSLFVKAVRSFSDYLPYW